MRIAWGEDLEQHFGSRFVVRVGSWNGNLANILLRRGGWIAPDQGHVESIVRAGVGAVEASGNVRDDRVGSLER